MASPASMSSLDRPSTHNSPRKRLAESFSGSPRTAMLGARPSTTSSSPSKPTARSSKVMFEQPGSGTLLRARTLLRVDPPMALRMPERRSKTDHADIFSVNRTAQLYDVDGEVVTLKSPGRRSRGVGSGAGSSASSSSPSLIHSPVRDLVRGHRSIRDYEFLVQACQRAGKTRLESQAYYKLSILYENERRTRGAASALKSFLNVSRRLQDYDSEVLALNSLGILLYKMGGDHTVEAAECHAQHFEIGEPVGKFIAEINLGMCCAAQEQWSNSLDHFKDALQFAIRLGNVEGESISLANVAWAAENAGDLETARTCFERHIELAESLGDRKSIPDAYHDLGKVRFPPICCFQSNIASSSNTCVCLVDVYLSHWLRLRTKWVTINQLFISLKRHESMRRRFDCIYYLTCHNGMLSLMTSLVYVWPCSNRKMLNKKRKMQLCRLESLRQQCRWTGTWRSLQNQCPQDARRHIFRIICHDDSYSMASVTFLLATTMMMRWKSDFVSISILSFPRWFLSIWIFFF
jgi:hypothetical protein